MAILTPNPPHLRDRCALVAGIRELKTVMKSLYFERLNASRSNLPGSLQDQFHYFPHIGRVKSDNIFVKF